MDTQPSSFRPRIIYVVMCEKFFHVGDNVETENIVGSMKRDKGILMRVFDRA